MPSKGPFTNSELILCAYIARFGDANITPQKIQSSTGRKVSSVKPKVRNFIAQLVMRGLDHWTKKGYSPLTQQTTGVKAAESPKWLNSVSDWISKPQAIHLEKCLEILSQHIVLPEELDSAISCIEGATSQVLVNRYERDRGARDECIKHHGCSCMACEFNFKEAYGPDAANFIHIHHIKPLSELKKEYKVNPKTDLVPVCPNCHAVIHLGGKLRSIKEVKILLKKA